MKAYFSPKDLCDITGVSLRTLHYYHDIELLIPHHIEDNGYRLYSVEDISKLQYILFLRELDLTLKEINDYFKSDINTKNEVLRKNYDDVIKKRDKLNVIIEHLDYYFKQESNEEIEVTNMKEFDLYQQYENEAALKYGDTKYYQSYEEQQQDMNDSEKKENYKNINVELNTFFDEMSDLFSKDVSIKEASTRIKKLEDILKLQVPNCDKQFMSYITTTYVDDERFAKNINKNRNEGLNRYIANAINEYITY